MADHGDTLRWSAEYPQRDPGTGIVVVRYVCRHFWTGPDGVRVEFTAADVDDLGHLNRLGAAGWDIVTVHEGVWTPPASARVHGPQNYANRKYLMKREAPTPG